ncbi:hypothetical protein DCAR_0207576 [Daucus carota subsp. sativus]|uniref:Uncharacterized protein n=1 Tax=Daucus carota subsp. sativus TaxID=79200 RepID=A0AAF0WFB5_DAUCS|nr:hypothetical protein DCAR_0207576 [Daucus carota subsp. sativus]
MTSTANRLPPGLGGIKVAIYTLGRRGDELYMPDGDRVWGHWNKRHVSSSLGRKYVEATRPFIICYVEPAFGSFSKLRRLEYTISRRL